jgi:hypothetical protein
MDPELFGKVSAIADRITTISLVLVWMFLGARGIWFWASTIRNREDQIKELKLREVKLEAKLDAQERLIDRLSGVADRSTSMATTAVVHQVHERRHREDAA